MLVCSYVGLVISVFSGARLFHLYGTLYLVNILRLVLSILLHNILGLVGIQSYKQYNQFKLIGESNLYW
jgi:hypothetical protein